MSIAVYLLLTLQYNCYRHCSISAIDIAVYLLLASQYICYWHCSITAGLTIND